MVKWGVFRSKAQPLATRLELLRPGFEQDTDWGILNGPASNTYCNDFDQLDTPIGLPPEPRGPAGPGTHTNRATNVCYTNTPSGGRHYFWRYTDPTWGFRIGAAPGVDIPWVTKLYAPPVIREGRPHVTAPVYDGACTRRNTAHTEPGIGTKPGGAADRLSPQHLGRCEFIKAFRTRRNDPTWDGRYAAARAYVSLAQHEHPSDLWCGPDYQWQAHIERDCGRPASCAQIDRVFGCSQWDSSNAQCRLAPGVRSPIGLANYFERQQRIGETADGKRISTINIG